MNLICIEIDLKNPVQPKPSANLYADDYYGDQHDDNPQQAQQQQRQLPAIQCDFNPTAHQLHAQTVCLRQLESLHQDLEDLHGIFQRLHGGVVEQGEQVARVADDVDESKVSVERGERQLRQALAYKKAMYPMAGALLGTCLGGPIGMFAGLKMGGIAALGCGILGFTGGAAIKNSEALQAQEPAAHADDANLVSSSNAEIAETSLTSIRTNRKND